MYHLFFPYKNLLRSKNLTERALSLHSKLSRGCLRALSKGADACSIKSLLQLSNSLQCELTIIVSPEEGLSDLSTVATAMHISHDGFSSWKIHLMNFVDEFRRTRDTRLILLSPPKDTHPKIKALMASVVLHLCEEFAIQCPAWAEKRYFLNDPWFLSESDALKASALLESPLNFRKNNIFVHDNFLARA